MNLSEHYNYLIDLYNRVDTDKERDRIAKLLADFGNMVEQLEEKYKLYEQRERQKQNELDKINYYRGRSTDKYHRNFPQERSEV